MTEMPPQDAVPAPRRAKPYIYSNAEISALLAAALTLPPAKALRRWTYHCLFGLIAVAGLRHSEALDLRRDDVDLGQGILTIRETKFGKSQLVPLRATTVAVLSNYAARRDAHRRQRLVRRGLTRKPLLQRLPRAADPAPFAD